MPEAVVVAATRSPIGRAGKGSLREMRPDDLAAQIVQAALGKVPELDPTTIDDLIVGCGNPGGEQGFNIARVVAVLCGLRTVPGCTVARYCASSLQAMRMAMHAIRAGEGDVYVAAGVETVSRFDRGSSDRWPDTKNPIFDAAQARTSERALGGSDPWTPAGELPDIYVAMGQTAENVAEIEGISREEMDRFAAQSQQRAVDAQGGGRFDQEITPVALVDGSWATADDGPRPGTTFEKLAGLKPVFRPDGRVTAGNACPLNDGAAAVIVMSDRRAAELGLQPLARIVSSGVSALDPEIMGLGPIEASRQALRRAGMTIDDVDFVEINEAFAAQVIPSARHLGVADDKLNVRGGAIALGHPFGMTGARMMTTLLNILAAQDATVGLETMCVGGGQGMAMIVERLT
jgi:acetyl-CoA C-acetyltransferase